MSERAGCAMPCRASLFLCAFQDLLCPTLYLERQPAHRKILLDGLEVRQLLMNGCWMNDRQGAKSRNQEVHRWPLAIATTQGHLAGVSERALPATRVQMRHSTPCHAGGGRWGQCMAPWYPGGIIRKPGWRFLTWERCWLLAEDFCVGYTVNFSY